MSLVPKIAKTLSEGFADPKPAREITQGVHERAIPTLEQEQAVDLLDRSLPPDKVHASVPDMGRPSAIDPTQRNINFGYLETEDDILSLIDNVSTQQDHFVDPRRGVVSNEQTLAESETALELKQILGRKPGQAWNASQMTAARRIMVDSAETLMEAARIVKGTNATESDMLRFRQLAAQHAAIQESVAGATAEAGRALQAFRVPAQGGLVAEDHLRAVLNRAGGDRSTQAMAELILESGGDPAKIAKVTRETWHASSADMFLEYWINGLLSNPTTHAVNMTSNALVAGYAIPERLGASLVGSIRQAMGGEAGVAYGEAMAQMYGLAHGFKDSLKVFWHALKTGEAADPSLKMEIRQDAITSNQINHLMQKGLLGKGAQAVGVDPSSIRIGGPVAMGVDLMGEFFRLPGRALTAEDALFKTLGYRQELYARAYREVAKKGLKGDEAAAELQRLVKEPPEDMHMDAIDASRYQTFTNPLGKYGQTVQSATVQMPFLKLIMPFIRTPTNIIKYVGMRSPLAPMAKSWRADVAAGGARADLAIARAGMGSTMMMMAGLWAEDGVITGKGPADRGVRDAMRRQGWQPYSIKVGDKYYSYNRLDPLGMMLGLAADTMTVSKYGDDLAAKEAAGTVMIALAQNLTSKSYLSGVADLVNMIDDPVRYGDRYLNRMAGTLIPMTSGVAQVERVVDPTVRHAWTAMDSIIGRIPGWSEELPPRRNLWGSPIVLEGGLGWDMVTPIYTSTEKTNAVDAEIVNNEINLTMPKKAFGQGDFAVPLKPKEYDRYIQLAGEPAFKELETFVKSKGYQQLSEGPNGMRATMVRQVVNRHREVAKIKLLKEFPELQEALDQANQAKLKEKRGEGTFRSGIQIQ
jgi:hypothetical protein